MTNYKELVKQRTSIPGYVEEVERFEAWWNKNLATVIAYYDGYYRVFLLVYDSFYSTYRPAVFPHDYDSIYWGDSGRERKKHGWPSDVESEASWLRGELSKSYGKYYDNPILLIHPYCDRYRSFETFVTEPYVVKKYSTSYLKPFDVVKTDMVVLDHVGVYLGKTDSEFKVCQFTKKGTKIDRWSDFLEGEVVSYHPVIPFKNYKDIAGQIVWAKDNDFRKNNYDLHRRNCEHFSNMIVYGINFSEQIEKKKGVFVAGAAATAVFGGGATGLNVLGVVGSIVLAPATGGTSLLWGAVSAGAAGAGFAATVKCCERTDDNQANDGKKTVNLRDEIRDTDNRLGKKFDFETEKYETKYLQEVPPKENCRIM